MVPEGDINIQEIALEYLKAIMQSKNKELTVKQIVDDIKKKYPSEKQPLIINELRNNLITLSLQHSYIRGPGFGGRPSSKPGSNRQVLYEVRAQANEDYIKYVKLLDDLTKE